MNCIQYVHQANSAYQACVDQFNAIDIDGNDKLDKTEIILHLNRSEGHGLSDADALNSDLLDQKAEDIFAQYGSSIDKEISEAGKHPHKFC